MARVDFPLDDDVTPVAGFAILRTFTDEGAPLTTYTKFGQLSPEEVIGMLTAVLDQLRYEFTDHEDKEILDLLLSTYDDETD